MYSRLSTLIFSFLILSCSLLSSEEPKKVLAIGAPTIDFLLDVDESFLKNIKGDKGGSEVVDWPTFKSIVYENRSFLKRFASGGSAANTIKGLANLKIETSFFGRIGNDDLGEYFSECLSNLGIKPWLIETEKPTQQVVCLITPDRQRTMRCFLGATLDLSEKDLISDMFEGIDLVHIEGYALRNGLLVKNALLMAKEKGCQTSFDMGAQELAREFKKELYNELFPLVDILFANEDESFALTGLTPHKACEELQKYTKIAIVLVGKEGCFVGSKGQVIYCPTTPSQMIDSTGAGDLFASGFIYGHLSGLPLNESAQIGNILGGAVVEEVGAEISEGRWRYIHYVLKSLNSHSVR